MNIVMNERDYAIDALETCSLGAKPYETLSRIARYYSSEKYKKPEIRKLLESFMLKCDPTINLVKWQEPIDKLVKDSDKYPLIELKFIPITARELEVCGSVGGKQMQRLIFTLICLAKYSNAVNEKNDNWVNRTDREVFKMANVVTSIKRQSLMLNDLRELGLVRFSNKVDNINTKVLCIDQDGEPVLYITDYRNLGYQYMRYCGEPYFECAECGIVIKRTSNAQKYCCDCAISVNRQKTLENWRNNVAV